MTIIELLNNYNSPLAVALIVAVIGYLLSLRSKKFDRLNSLSKENLELTIYPMFFQLKQIMKSNNAQEREDRLSFFFQYFSNLNTPIYRLGDLSLLDRYYIVEEKYAQFKERCDEESWINFWVRFYEFYKIIETCYWDHVSTIFQEYRWFHYLSRKNFFVRFLMETVVTLLDIVVVIFRLSIYVILIVLFCSVFDLHLLDKQIINLLLCVPPLLLLIIGFLLILANTFLPYWKNSRIRNNTLAKTMINKYFPSLLSSWEQFFYFSIDRTSIEIPPMVDGSKSVHSKSD